MVGSIILFHPNFISDLFYKNSLFSTKISNSLFSQNCRNWASYINTLRCCSDHLVRILSHSRLRLWWWLLPWCGSIKNEKIMNRGMEVIVDDGFLTFQLEINRCISLRILNINIMFLTVRDSIRIFFCIFIILTRIFSSPIIELKTV